MPKKMWDVVQPSEGVILHPVALQGLIESEGGNWSFPSARLATARLSRSKGQPVVLHRRTLTQFRGHGPDGAHQDRVIAVEPGGQLYRCRSCDAYFVDVAGLDPDTDHLCIDCLDAQMTV